MAWRNVLRNRRRSALTAAGMALAVTICAAMMTFTNGMYGQIRDVLVTRTLAHVQVHHPEWPGRRRGHDVVADADAALAALDGLPEVRAATLRVHGSALLGAGERTEGAQLLGVMPAREEAIRDIARRVVDGAWLADAPGAGVVLGKDLARRLGVRPGDTIVAVTQAFDGSLGNELYRVTGIVASGNPTLDRGTAFLHVADLRALLAMGPAAHELVAVAHGDDDATIEALAGAVRGAVPGPLVRTWWEVDPTTATLFGLQLFQSVLLMGFFYGISAVGVVNTLLMSVFERTREIGMMRALGMRPGEVVRLVVAEALLLAVLAVAAGLVGAALLDAYLVVYGIDISVRGEGFAMGEMTFDPIIRGRVTVDSLVQPVVGVFLFSGFAAVWPAWRAARLQPIQAIREGAG